MLTPTWTARTRCGPLTARPEQVEARRPQLGRPRPSEEPRRSARPVGLARRLGEADPATGMADQEAAPGGHEEEACEGNAARNYETLCGTTHGPEAQDAARVSRARGDGLSSQELATGFAAAQAGGGAGKEQVGPFGHEGYHRDQSSQRGPPSQGARDLAWGEQVGRFESQGPYDGRPSQHDQPPQRTREQAREEQVGSFGPGGRHWGQPSRRGPASRGAQEQAWEGQGGLFAGGGYYDDPPRGPRLELRDEEPWGDARADPPRGLRLELGTRSPGGTHVALTGIGGRPTGGTALRRGRGQARCTAHQGGVKTKSKRGHRSSREWGTTAQGVPALEDPPWEVGPRAGGGPARTTRRAMGPTWITIPRGGSWARRGDPGGVIASQGTVSRPCALRDGMDAWAPRATQVVTRLDRLNARPSGTRHVETRHLGEARECRHHDSLWTSAMS